MLFTVQHKYISGWSDAGWDMIFHTRAAAQREIADHIAETVEAEKRGDMAEAYSPADYRVVRRADGITSS